MARNNPVRAFVLAWAAAAAAAVVALLVAYAPAAGAASDRLPDLGMAHARNPQIQYTGGRKLLRFDSIVVNVGAGPFELRGAEPTSGEMTKVYQRILDDAGGSREVETPATMDFGGDGHNHWHVTNLQDFDLERLDNGTNIRTGAKMGFCFFDNFNYGSSASAHYTQPNPNTPPTAPRGTENACAGGTSATQTQMGISPGWGDIYNRTLPDQYIDVTGLTSGRYRLRLTADADGWFVESNNGNNESWVVVQLKRNGVSILSYGPSA